MMKAFLLAKISTLSYYTLAKCRLFGFTVNIVIRTRGSVLVYLCYAIVLKAKCVSLSYICFQSYSRRIVISQSFQSHI